MTRLAVAETHPDCRVLGPGSRFVIWVQGCGIGCRECVSPQWIPFEGGRATEVAELADTVARTARDGLTLSGGEPFAQAGPLTELIERVRRVRDLSVMSYSGYTIEHLRDHGTPDQRSLLARLDILVDGPFLAHRQAALRWRGSSNQRLHLLTDRHADVAEQADASEGLQLEITDGPAVRWLGVPVVAGFRERFEQRLGLAARPDEKESKQ